MGEPASLEAESAVLGSMLISARACAAASDLLASDDFYRHAHRLMFDTAVGLYRAGETSDTVTVTEALARSGHLDEVGGPAAIHDLSTIPSSAAVVEHYALLVSRAARARRAVEEARRFAQTVETADDVDATIDAHVEALTSRRGAAVTVDKDQVAAEMVRRLGGEQRWTTWPTGWSNLDRIWQLPQAALTVVTGLPGSGKSTWLDVLLHNVCRRDDKARVAFFSPEQSPAEDHLWELSTTWLAGDPASADGGRVREAMDWWTARVEWIDDLRDNTPSAVLAVARKVAPSVLIVDPYNNLAPDDVRARGERQDLYIQDLLRRLRRFARDTGTAVVVVAHPRQTAIVQGTEAVFHVPTAAHISGGQEWWNHADTIVCVWRNLSGEEPGEFGQPEDVTLAVQKSRRRQWGREGKVQLRFVESERRYERVGT